MKILFTAILMIAIPFSAAAVQYCQEVDPTNLAHIAAATEIHNARKGLALTSQQFISETMKKASLAEIMWKEQQATRELVEAQAATRNELLEQMRETLIAREAELGETW